MCNCNKISIISVHENIEKSDSSIKNVAKVSYLCDVCGKIEDVEVPLHKSKENAIIQILRHEPKLLIYTLVVIVLSISTILKYIVQIIQVK